jgi:cyclic pyranopterin phosphate synthase
MLTFEEILRLCGIMAEMGIRKIKVTGGEPLIHRGMASFLKNLKALPGIESVTLTTNGFLLGQYLGEAEALAPGSLPDGVNISLDALDQERFKRITRKDGVSPIEIFPFVDRLLKKQIPVKINCVPVRGFNEEEITPIAGLAKDRNIAVRFIELMPLSSAAGLKPITGKETAAFLEEAYGSLTPFFGVLGSGPAVYYSLPGFTGKIGFINPLSDGFCESCNRLRLTPEGLLKPCLSAGLNLDLRALLRSGAADSEIIRAITGIIAKKPHFHTFSGIYGASPAEIEGRHPGGMFRIGG